MRRLIFGTQSSLLVTRDYAMNDSLTETAVSSQLTTKWIGHNYHYYPSIGSTNEELKNRVAEESNAPIPEGTVILTEFQSQGKGRLQRKWEAPPQSSLLFSTLFRPNWSGEQANWLTMIAALAVVEAIEIQTNLQPSIKWPNDIVLQQNGMWHKVCGLLLEGNVDGNGRLQTAVMGIGINVNIPTSNLPEAVTPPTSLQIATGNSVPRLPLLLTILQRLEDLYETAVAGQSPHEKWNGRLITHNQSVTITHLNTEQKIHGIAIGTTPNGALIIRDEKQKQHIITAGDVTLRQ